MQSKILEQLIKQLPKEKLEQLLAQISKELGASEHFKWCVEWDIKKYVSDQLDKLGSLATPYEHKIVKENITLDGGIEMMWKLVTGDTATSTTPFNNANAKIFVGSSTTTESASQTGVITQLGYASMDATYPQVSGRSVIFQGTFASDTANGTWREACVYNGSGANAVALNRKVEDMGTKASGTSWTLRVTISAVTS